MSYYRQGPFRPPGSGVTIGIPPVTPSLRLIMIVCGAVWLVQILLGFTGFHVGNLSFEGIFGVVPALVIRGFVWQLATYMFLHSPDSIMHILFNLMFIWMFGGELERHWGSRGFLRYYLVCGVGGGVFIVAMGMANALLGAAPASAYTPTIGASGALFGLIVAYGMMFAERRVLFMLVFPMKASTFSMLMFAIAFFFTFAGEGGNISHIGHVGGAVVGFLYLKRAWRLGEFYRELRWKLRRRRFRVTPRDDRDDFDRWVN